mgnify:CR=1 FL=1
MKAAVLKEYNKKNLNLEIKDIPVPQPNDNEVLIKVMAAGVNPLDNMITRGEVKLIVPYKTPLVMGNELSGIVETVGKNVTQFQVGDKVYGRMPLGKIGAFAEYAAVNEKALAKMPEYLSFEEGASVPLTALTAQQALELMEPKKDETIFISGGTGSLGAMAIPIAKAMGLKVITNGNGDNEDRARILGADQFIDYKKQDYAAVISNVDYVLDTLGDRELPKEFTVLKDGGVLVSLRGLPNGEFAKRAGLSGIKQLMFGIVGRKYDKMARKRNQQYHFIFVHEDGKGLSKINEMFSEIHLEPSVDTVYSLEEINKALSKVAGGKSKGKTVIKIE